MSSVAEFKSNECKVPVGRIQARLLCALLCANAPADAGVVLGLHSVKSRIAKMACKRARLSTPARRVVRGEHGRS